jgi:formylmethanofuran dehydrogenase subunit C
MRPLVLTLREPPAQTVDASPLLPERFAGLGERPIAALQLQTGNRLVPLGELFGIEMGDAETVVLRGATGRLDRVGQGMTRGAIRIEGDAGAWLGHAMRGGEILVTGSADLLAGSAMSGGVLRIEGNAGDFLGGALAGERAGMTGGAVLVGGRAGDRAGDAMRRGLVLVQGHAGDFAASRMIAGTLIVLGRCGADPGFGMKRGTLLLSGEPERRLATFDDNGRHDLPWLRLLASHCARLGWSGRLPGADGGRLRRLTGDLSNSGKGEILIGEAAA